MTVRTSFVEYLKTGAIGPVSIGSTRAQLFQCFGNPERMRTGRFGPVACLYGSVEFGLEDSLSPYAKVDWLQVEHFPWDGRNLGHGKLYLDSGTSRARDLIDIRFFRRFALRNRVRLIPGRHSTGERAFLTDGNVEVILWDDEDDPHEIATFSMHQVPSRWFSSRIPIGFGIRCRLGIADGPGMRTT